MVRFDINICNSSKRGWVTLSQKGEEKGGKHLIQLGYFHSFGATLLYNNRNAVLTGKRYGFILLDYRPTSIYENEVTEGVYAFVEFFGSFRTFSTQKWSSTYSQSSVCLAVNLCSFIMISYPLKLACKLKLCLNP